MKQRESLLQLTVMKIDLRPLAMDLALAISGVISRASVVNFSDMAGVRCGNGLNAAAPGSRLSDLTVTDL